MPTGSQGRGFEDGATRGSGRSSAYPSGAGVDSLVSSSRGSVIPSQSGGIAYYRPVGGSPSFSPTRSPTSPLQHQHHHHQQQQQQQQQGFPHERVTPPQPQGPPAQHGARRVAVPYQGSPYRQQYSPLPAYAAPQPRTPASPGGRARYPYYPNGGGGPNPSPAAEPLRYAATSPPLMMQQPPPPGARRSPGTGYRGGLSPSAGRRDAGELLGPEEELLSYAPVFPPLPTTVWSTFSECQTGSVEEEGRELEEVFSSASCPFLFPYMDVAARRFGAKYIMDEVFASHRRRQMALREAAAAQQPANETGTQRESSATPAAGRAGNSKSKSKSEDPVDESLRLLTNMISGLTYLRRREQLQEELLRRVDLLEASRLGAASDGVSSSFHQTGAAYNTTHHLPQGSLADSPTLSAASITLSLSSFGTFSSTLSHLFPLQHKGRGVPLPTPTEPLNPITGRRLVYFHPEQPPAAVLGEPRRRFIGVSFRFRNKKKSRTAASLRSGTGDLALSGEAAGAGMYEWQREHPTDAAAVAAGRGDAALQEALRPRTADDQLIASTCSPFYYGTVLGYSDNNEEVVWQERTMLFATRFRLADVRFLVCVEGLCCRHCGELQLASELYDHLANHVMLSGVIPQMDEEWGQMLPSAVRLEDALARRTGRVLSLHTLLQRSQKQLKEPPQREGRPAVTPLPLDPAQGLPEAVQKRIGTAVYFADDQLGQACGDTELLRRMRFERPLGEGAQGVVDLYSILLLDGAEEELTETERETGGGPEEICSTTEPETVIPQTTPGSSLPARSAGPKGEPAPSGVSPEDEEAEAEGHPSATPSTTTGAGGGSGRLEASSSSKRVRPAEEEEEAKSEDEGAEGDLPRSKKLIRPPPHHPVHEHHQHEEEGGTETVIHRRSCKTIEGSKSEGDWDVKLEKPGEMRKEHESEPEAMIKGDSPLTKKSPTLTEDKKSREEDLSRNHCSKRYFVVKTFQFVTPQQAMEHYRKSVRFMSILAQESCPFSLIAYYAVQLLPDGLTVRVLMPYLAEGDVAECIRTSPLPLEESEMLSVALQLSQALVFLHQRNPPLVHGDINPSNVMLDHGLQHVVLMDLDASCEMPYLNAEGRVSSSLREYSSQWSRHSSKKKSDVLGTSAYMAPETMSSERLLPASDMWSLGVLLYVMAVMPDFPTLKDPRSGEEVLLNAASCWATAEEERSISVYRNTHANRRLSVQPNMHPELEAKYASGGAWGDEDEEEFEVEPRKAISAQHSRCIRDAVLGRGYSKALSDLILQLLQFSPFRRPSAAMLKERLEEMLGIWEQAREKNTLCI